MKPLEIELLLRVADVKDALADTVLDDEIAVESDKLEDCKALLD